MTVEPELPEGGYGASVPRPPIGFSIHVPDHWTVLDLNPETWDRWLDAFLDQRLAVRTGAAAERGPARRALGDLLASLQQAEVFMAAILAAEVGGDLVSASATLAWRRLDESAAPIPLEGLRQVYLRAPASPGEDPAARRVSAVEVGAGGAVKLTTRQTTEVPYAKTSTLVSMTQYFVPVLDTNWLAAITATTPVPALASGVEQVADEMAASLTFAP